MSEHMWQHTQKGRKHPKIKKVGDGRLRRTRGERS